MLFVLLAILVVLVAATVVFGYPGLITVALAAVVLAMLLIVTLTADRKSA